MSTSTETERNQSAGPGWAPAASSVSPIEVVQKLEGIPDLAEAGKPNPRIRQVWTKAKWKLLNRTADMLEAEGVKIKMRCTLAQCPDQQIRIVSQASAPTGAILRCGCTDRIFARF